ncbi:MAG: DUF123 domain-containing protein [Halobacteriales archaeon]
MGVDHGTYTLLLRVAAPTTIRVGALGERAFPAGVYAYTGSAFGPGGFARIERHRRVAAGDADTRHWHIDYLLPSASVRDVYTAAGAAIECAVARSLPGERVDGFGASDCDCDSHLAYTTDPGPLRQRLEALYDDVPEADR